MMTRRIVRTLIQLTAAIVFALIIVLMLDRNYKVLPDAIHNHLPSHHPGMVITDVMVVSCGKLNPFSSCDIDDEGWTILQKDLYLQTTWNAKAYIYVSRKHEKDLVEGDKVLLDLKVGPKTPEQGPGEVGEWEKRTNGIWLLRSSKRHASDSDHVVTAVDVLFGDDAEEVRDGWAIARVPLLLDQGKNDYSAHVTIRKGVPPERKKPKLQIDKNGKFKILQVADLHLSTGEGKCREAVPDSYQDGPCRADPRTLEFVDKMILDEKPNFVVLSGDQVNGETSPDTQSAMFKIIALLKRHKLPWAAIFGNHDDSPQGLSREAQMEIMETLPFSLSTAGPADVDGVGNYYLEILAEGGSEHSAVTVYFLDTHAYSPDERNYPGYGWIKPSQIEWFRETAQKLKRPHKQYSKHHLDISFIHIPLTEYTNFNNSWVGGWREGVTAPVYNSGFRDALVEQGVVMVSAGHDHANDYCITSPEGEGEERFTALWMCYAGGVGFGGYAGYDNYIRRVRVFEIDTNTANIETWKRVEYGEVGELGTKVDHQLLVQGGVAIPPPVQALPTATPSAAYIKPGN